MRRAALALALGLAAGCTTTDVHPVPARGYPVASICIERNPAVQVEDFLGVVEQGFARHGIAARVYEGAVPDGCEYTLWYDARRRWDLFRPVLGYAELRVRYHGETIGSATWLARPSLSLFKWRSTEAKIGPLVDQLLADFPPPPGG